MVTYLLAALIFLAGVAFNIAWIYAGLPYRAPRFRWWWW
jgi:hypothetical protein